MPSEMGIDPRQFYPPRKMALFREALRGWADRLQFDPYERRRINQLVSMPDRKLFEALQMHHFLQNFEDRIQLRIKAKRAKKDLDPE